MASIGLAFAAALAAATAPAPVPASSVPAIGSGSPCCADPFATTAPNGERPLSITIESGIQVGRLGLTGHQDGDAAIDPQTGAKQVGPNMIDLGGLSFQGKATITGQPLRPVRIDLPPVAMLDANGQLQFNFGATISSRGGQGGDFRGRIPIRVEYF